MSAFSLLVAEDSPQLWWRLDELAGATAKDSSGNGRDGTVQLGSLGAWGQPGIRAGNTGLRSGPDPFSPTWVRSTYNPFSNATSQTFEFVLMLDAGDPGLHDIFEDDFGDTPSPQLTYDADLNRGQLSFVWTGIGPFVVYQGVGDLTGRFVHLAVNADPVGNTVEALIDGKSLGVRTNASYAYNVSAANFALNDSVTGGSATLRGIYDEVAIYSPMLSVERLAQHAAALPLGQPQPRGGGSPPRGRRRRWRGVPQPARG